MGAANSRAFGLPGVRERAMGYQSPGLIGTEPRTGKTGGIREFDIVELAPGTVIVRFGQKRLVSGRTNLSSRGLIGGALEGEWWLEWPVFKRIEAYAATRRIPIGAAVSALCVVPIEWSDLDVVVVATLMAPLLAYDGLPNPADVQGTHVPVVRDLEGKEIRQLFIPGLGNGDVVRQALMWGRPKFLSPYANPA